MYSFSLLRRLKPSQPGLSDFISKIANTSSADLIPDPFTHVSLKENLSEAETVSFTFAFTLT